MLDSNRRVAQRLGQPLPPHLERVRPLIAVRDELDWIRDGSSRGGRELHARVLDRENLACQSRPFVGGELLGPYSSAGRLQCVPINERRASAEPVVQPLPFLLWIPEVRRIETDLLEAIRQGAIERRRAHDPPDSCQRVDGPPAERVSMRLRGRPTSTSALRDIASGPALAGVRSTSASPPALMLTESHRIAQ